MSTYDWRATRAEAVSLFAGELPHPQTENDVVGYFAERPDAVVHEIHALGASIAAGNRPRSAWAVLRKRLADGWEARRNVVVTGVDGDRAARVRAAESWIAHAGVGIDRESELLDELFGGFGMLRAYADDEQLRASLVRLWQAGRPRAAALERREQELTEAAARARREAERLSRDRQQQVEQDFEGVGVA